MKTISQLCIKIIDVFRNSIFLLQQTWDGNIHAVFDYFINDAVWHSVLLFFIHPILIFDQNYRESLDWFENEYSEIAGVTD